MADGTLIFRLVPNLPVTTGRAIGFLEGHRELNAAAVFRTLSPPELKYQMYSMNRWVNNQLLPTSRCHKFEREHKDIIVFKDVENQHRFYGFTCNPQPNTNKRFHISALTNYAQKKEDRSDPTDRKRAAEWLKHAAAMIAIQFIFQDGEEGTTQ